uniref:Uncharacterized protein n=1 Tax=Hyaloperonospora arabidopsidis (strain Emoy2) TaxID=559515 RepID=M4BKP8_HYAAE
MQRMRSAWRKARSVRATEGHEELQDVLLKMRRLGQRGDTLKQVQAIAGCWTIVDQLILGLWLYDGQFQESPLVAKLRSPMQFHGLGNLMYSNADDNDEEVQKALHVWKIAMDQWQFIMSDVSDFGGLIVRFPGKRRESGEGTRKNEKKAFELYKKCAEVGIPPAYMNVCNMYTYGTGTEKNEMEALKWLTKAAEAGDPSAKSRLGEYYLHGNGGVQKDRARAIQYWKEAAAAGVVMAQYNLGNLFLIGDGVPQNALQAEALFRAAAEKGFVMAMVNLAQMYRTGYGKVPKDLDTARKWLELAAPHDPNAKELMKAMAEPTVVES